MEDLEKKAAEEQAAKEAAAKEAADKKAADDKAAKDAADKKAADDKAAKEAAAKKAAAEKAAKEANDVPTEVQDFFKANPNFNIAYLANDTNVFGYESDAIRHKKAHGIDFVKFERPTKK